MFAVLGPPETYVRGPGPLLGPILAVLGRSWAYVRGPGPSWDLCWRSWAEKLPKPEQEQGHDAGIAPKAPKDRIFLSRSWGLRWRS